MESLTDKIIRTLKDRSNSFIGNLSTKETVANSSGYRDGLLAAADIIESLEKSAEFEEIARVMMKHLGNRTDLYCPHHKVLIDNTNAELLQGSKAIGFIGDYIKD